MSEYFFQLTTCFLVFWLAIYVYWTTFRWISVNRIGNKNHPNSNHPTIPTMNPNSQLAAVANEKRCRIDPLNYHWKRFRTGAVPVRVWFFFDSYFIIVIGGYIRQLMDFITANYKGPAYPHDFHIASHFASLCLPRDFLTVLVMRWASKPYDFYEHRSCAQKPVWRTMNHCLVRI